MMRGMTDPKRLLTAKELAAALQVSPRTILDWHRHGRIPGVQPTGSTVRFDLDEVLAALKGGAR
jgi:excisionase family DNA binding protein